MLRCARHDEKLILRQNSMTKKALILYASRTGNTEKIACVFRQVFEQAGWICDMAKITADNDPVHPAFDLSAYDFLCAGSPVIGSLPEKHLVRALSRHPASPHARNADYFVTEEGERAPRSLMSIAPAPVVDETPLVIRFGPESKKGVVFATFGGVHLGPPEAAPALAWLALEMEHLRFRCLGRFACPGRMGKSAGWFEDLPERPNQQDLADAAAFLEGILAGIEA
jgi:hypothetical protein